jgi:glycosyltransferase involved in cell wall biosynthesis
MLYSPISLRCGGGVEWFILDLVRYLNKYAVSSVIVCSNSIAEAEKERIPTQRIRAILETASAKYFEFRCLPLPQILSSSSTIPSFKEIRRIMNIAKECDIIYSNSGHVFYDLLLFAIKKILKKPVVSGYHLPLHSWGRMRDIYINTIGRQLLGEFDAHHILNNYFLYLLKLWGLKNIYLIQNGVDTERFRPRSLMKKQKKFRILFVGRLVFEKGIDILCESIKMLNENKAFLENVAFIIAGSGPMEPVVQRLSEQYPNVTYLGYLGESLPKIYRECDLFVMPSRGEIFPLVLLEAQASGLPVIAFDVAGPRCILVNEVTGTLVQKEDAVMLAKEIVRYYSIWLNDYERYEQMRLAARENVMKRFDWGTTASRIYNMLRETIEQKSSCS